MEHSLLLTLHLTGVVLFLGNIVITAVWKVMADYTRQAAVIAYAQRLVTVTDIAFTATGATLIAVSGTLLTLRLGEGARAGWLIWGQALFGISGLIWLIVLIPIQFRQSRLARAFAQTGSIPERYWQLSRWWAIWGTIATLLPLANLYLMVYKPA